jgi:hypothetical protein
MPGLITTVDIDGTLDTKNMVMGVLQKGIEVSNLYSLATQVKIPELTGDVIVSTGGSVIEDVDELEFTPIEGGSFSKVSFSLKKDRVKFAASDEATYKSSAGDPMTIQKTAAGASLAAVLDKKIVAALETTPQTTATAGAWSTASNNPLADLSKAVTGVLPYTADFVIMTPDVHTKYISNDFVKNAGQGNPAALKGAINTVPGLGLDIFVNSNLTAKSCIVGSSTGICVALGNGPVKVRNWDDPGLGAKVYQMDVYRQAKAPIFLTSGSKNMSAYQVTAVIT